MRIDYRTDPVTAVMCSVYEVPDRGPGLFSSIPRDLGAEMAIVMADDALGVIVVAERDASGAYRTGPDGALVTREERRAIRIVRKA